MLSSRQNTIKMETSHKKGLKKTTPEQFDMLIRELKKCPEMAKNGPSYAANRVQLIEKWERMVRQLNAIGPPRRSMGEWKKVWSDLKGRTKKKMFESNAYDIFTDNEGATSSNMEQSNEHILRILTSSKEAIAGALEEENPLPTRGSPTNSTISSFIKIEPTAQYESDCGTPALTEPVLTTLSPCISPITDNAESLRPRVQKRMLENKTLSSLRQQIECQSRYLEVLKAMTKSILAVAQRQSEATERQTIAIERQAAAAERQAAAMEAILAFLREKQYQEVETPARKCTRQ